MDPTVQGHCECPSTPKQQKSVRHYLRKYPDTVRPLLGNRSIETLNKSDISRLITEVKVTHNLPEFLPNGQQKKQDPPEQQKTPEDTIDDAIEDMIQDTINKPTEEQKREMQRATKTGYRPGSQRAVLAQALIDHDMSVDGALAYFVGADKINQKPLIFRGRQNPGDDLAPLPIWSGDNFDMDLSREDSQAASQIGRCRKYLFDVKAEMERSIRQVPEQKPEQKQAPKVPEQIREEFDSASQDNALEMIRWIQADLRPLAHRKGPDGRTLDEIGLRPAEYAARMLRQGIAPRAIKHAITMHYPAEARRALGVTSYDVTTFTPLKFGQVKPPSDVLNHDGQHRAMGYVQALLAGRIPAALVGPKGTGKTTLAKMAAEVLGVPFGFISMTAGTSPSKFEGRQKIGGDGEFFTSQFEQIFAGGGVYLFDEMDAAEPNLILLVNAALANGYFVNAKNEIVERHQDFMPMAGMNTLGLGNDANYVGRDKQDAAALDRWNAGRVQVELDEKLERKIFWSICSK
jgi:hypothetical protein